MAPDVGTLLPWFHSLPPYLIYSLCHLFPRLFPSPPPLPSSLSPSFPHSHPPSGPPSFSRGSGVPAVSTGASSVSTPQPTWSLPTWPSRPLWEVTGAVLRVCRGDEHQESASENRGWLHKEKNGETRAPGMAQLVKQLPLARVMILGSQDGLPALPPSRVLSLK